MQYEVLRLKRDSKIGYITFNRPERLNALNSQLVDEIHAALDELGEDDTIGVIILTGEGRGFCSGADQSGRYQSNETPQVDPVTHIGQTLNERTIVYLSAHVRATPQPVIAAVNGVAVGAGLSLALSCDIRVASDQARFASIFIKRSVVPDTGSSAMLPQLVGPGIAAEMALTGNVYDAQWAFHRGLVNKVVAHDQLMSEARAYADAIIANPPIAVRLTKRILYKSVHSEDLYEAIDNETLCNNLVMQTEDRRESVLSFLEKRQPVFHGR